MAFKMALSKTYFWPVKAHIPGDGKKETITFDAEFRRMSQSELEAMQPEMQVGKYTDRDLAKMLMVGWKGVQDEEGKPIEFSESMLDTLLDITGIPTYIVEAWGTSIKHGPTKN